MPKIRIKKPQRIIPIGPSVSGRSVLCRRLAACDAGDAGDAKFLQIAEDAVKMNGEDLRYLHYSLINRPKIYNELIYLYHKHSNDNSE